MIIGERNTMGQFAEEDEETGLNHFEARLWDSRLGRWLTTDPAGQYASPYLGMGNDPITSVDPNGCETNPIYDWNGNFLGTDDLGLQGEAIIMDAADFKQGMAHADAMVVGFTLDNMSWENALSFANNENFENFMNHFNSLSSRPDWDGIVTISEGIAWAKAHSNAGNMYPLYLDVGKMDFGSLGRKDFPRTGVETYVNLLYHQKFSVGNTTNTVYALGQTYMTLLNYGTGKVSVSNGSFNRYDWDVHGNLLRKTLIRMERARAGLNDSHGFPIIVYGTGYLNNCVW